jgi:hypothetical protein
MPSDLAYSGSPLPAHMVQDSSQDAQKQPSEGTHGSLARSSKLLFGDSLFSSVLGKQA